MKKFFAIAAIATVLVSCGDAKNAGEEAAKGADTAATQATDAATQVAGAADSAGNTVDTTVKAATDTSAKK